MKYENKNESKIKNESELNNNSSKDIEKSNSGTKDLTVGEPMKLIIGFALPMFLGMLFQQFYNVVDTMIVGNYLGVDAFAGVGATGCLNFMVLGFCSGLCNGFAVPIAQAFGAKDYKRLRKNVSNAAWLCIAFSVVLTALVTVFCKPILRLMNTPDNIIEYSYIYIVIIFAGIPFMILYNETAAILRALGDSKTPVIFLAVSSVLNIGLDFLLILGFGRNVDGAALATVIAQGLSGIVCLIYMKKKFDILKCERNELKIDTDIMKKLCGIGIPMGLQYSITGIGTVIIQTAVNGLGSVSVAAVTAAAKINMFISCPIEALGQTMSPYTGQNIGAGKIDRVEEGLKKAVLCGFVVSFFLLGVVLLFGENLIMLFLDEDNPEILRLAKQWLVCSVSCYFLLLLVNTVRFSIQGMGFSSFAMCAGVLEMVARGLAGVVLVPLIGFWGACFASPLAWLFADAFLIPAYISCKKKLKRKLI